MKKRFDILDIILIMLFVLGLTIAITQNSWGNKYLKANLPVPNAQWVELHGDSIESRQTFAVTYLVNEAQKKEVPNVPSN